MQTTTTEELKNNVQESFALLKRLRDEIRVEIHLAGMEAKDQWKKLEERFADAERVLRDAKEASKQKLDDVVEAFKNFRETLAQEKTQS